MKDRPALSDAIYDSVRIGGYPGFNVRPPYSAIPSYVFAPDFPDLAGSIRDVIYESD